MDPYLQFALMVLAGRTAAKSVHVSMVQSVQWMEPVSVLEDAQDPLAQSMVSAASTVGVL